MQGFFVSVFCPFNSREHPSLFIDTVVSVRKACRLVVTLIFLILFALIPLKVKRLSVATVCRLTHRFLRIRCRGGMHEGIE